MQEIKKQYAEFKRADKGHKTENAWFVFCRANKVPFITVKVRTKYADVHWDYISYEPDVDAALAKYGIEIRDAAIIIFRKYASKSSSFEVNNHLVWYRDMDIEGARQAASELYELVVAVVSRDC